MIKNDVTFWTGCILEDFFVSWALIFCVFTEGFQEDVAGSK